jgi:hypothetical protein
MPAKTITGRCHCGAIRYEYTGALSNAVWCHCEDCRRVSGAPALAWVTMQLEQFRFTHGAPHQYASSPKVLRGSCSGCGCALTWRRETSSDTVDVTIATLDDPTLVKPAEHIWMSDAIPWDQPRDGLPQHPKERPKA